VTSSPESATDHSRVLPEGSIGRSARLLSLPLGAVGRAGLGMGRKLLGAPAEQVDADLRAAAADQLFAVLGELKGGAMKFGQAMSMMEAMLPEDIAAPFRARLAALQDSAPPMPGSRVQGVLKAELGSDWRSHFAEFDLRPAAAASIGQVHRARLAGSGQPVAVKVQYPGADTALANDLKQLQRMAGAVSGLSGGLDVVSFTREIAERVSEEVDYTLEGANQQLMAEATAGHPRFTVPPVRLATRRVLVSDWVEGAKLTSLVGRPDAVRNAAGLDYVTFLFAGPSLGGVLHGDPHPGNFLVAADDRLAVVDFGLVSRMPNGLPAPMGRLIRQAVDHDADAMLDGLVAGGSARLPQPVRRARPHGAVPLQPGVDARPVPAGALPVRAVGRGDEAQHPARVQPDLPGVAGRHRRARAAGRDRRLRRRAAPLPARLRRLSQDREHRGTVLSGLGPAHAGDGEQPRQVDRAPFCDGDQGRVGEDAERRQPAPLRHPGPPGEQRGVGRLVVARGTVDVPLKLAFRAAAQRPAAYPAVGGEHRAPPRRGGPDRLPTAGRTARGTAGDPGEEPGGLPRPAAAPGA
jgi:hypothetical protein